MSDLAELGFAEEPGEDRVRAVERAIDVLQAFVGRSGGLKVTEIEKATGISRPTLYRLLRTLEKRRLVRTCDDPTRYDLDYGVVELAHTWLRNADFLARTEPALQALSDTAGETVALSLLRDGQRVYVRELASKNPLTFTRGVGAVEAVTSGASGIAILAAFSEDQVVTALETVPLVRQAVLRRQIAEARRRGYASSDEPAIPGASAVAAPVVDHTGAVLGSIGVYGPSSRFTPDKHESVGRAAIACAKRVSVLIA